MFFENYSRHVFATEKKPLLEYGTFIQLWQWMTGTWYTRSISISPLFGLRDFPETKK